jgi:mono/diheme cytochrome c family protein
MPIGPDRAVAPPRRGLVAAAVAVVAVLASACGGGSGGAASADGAAVFANHCASCHGADLRGTDSGPPLLHEYYVPSHHPDEAFEAAILEGVSPHHWSFGPMPALALDASQVEAVIAHVRAAQRAAGLIE